jgi:hypothetical protein
MRGGAASFRLMGFFEWKAIKCQKAKQPYAIAMKDGCPFGLGGLWENCAQPADIVSRREDQRHAVVNFADQFVGVGRDNREGAGPVT